MLTWVNRVGVIERGTGYIRCNGWIREVLKSSGMYGDGIEGSETSAETCKENVVAPLSYECACINC